MKYNLFIIVSFIIGTLNVSARDLPPYDATGVRNPMVKPVIKPEEKPVQTQQVQEKQERESRQKEINAFIAKCRIEGIIIKNNMCIAMINDREIKPGDKVADDNDIYVSDITLKSITFTLDNQNVIYYLIQEEK